MQEQARQLRLELLESKVASQEGRLQRLEEAELERQQRRDRRERRAVSPGRTKVLDQYKVKEERKPTRKG